MKEELHKNHRQRLRERFLRSGGDSLEQHELLELFLFEVQPRVNTNPTAHRLIERFSSLDGVLHASADELVEVKGVGRRTAEHIVSAAAAENARIESEISSAPISSFPRAANYLIHRMRDGRAACLLMLDRELRLIECRAFERASVLLMADACITSGATGAVIGCRSEALGELVENADIFARFNITLWDVISVDGLNAKSAL